MAKRKRNVTKQSLEKRQKLGFGQGEGPDYKPGLRIQDVASTGRRHRVKGEKTGRVHHYMSDLELKYHMILDSSPIVIDIREQYPLDLETTRQIAEQINVQHPKDPKTKHDAPITTDFHITIFDGTKRKYVARTIKPKSKLTKRVVAKFWIEQIYYATKQIDWGIVTEAEIPTVVSKNVKLLLDYTSLDGRGIEPQIIINIAEFLTPHVNEGSLPIRKVTTACDQTLGLDPGTTLPVFYNLIWNKQWQINLFKPINVGQPLHLLSENNSSNGGDQ